MKQWSVGSTFPPVAGRVEGTFFEIDETGLMFIFNFSNPSSAEIASVSEGAPFEIREMVLKGVLWVFVKCGNMPWAEAPYSPHLSRNPALQLLESDSQGYGLTLVMVDQSSNTVRHLRLIGLGHSFSEKLRQDVEALKAQPFDQAAHDSSILQTTRYNKTSQLVAMCGNYWRLK